MKKLMLAVVVTSLPIVALAQDYEKGLAAALSGDFATALQEWQPLADQGDAAAQVAVGWLFRNGKGVPQDFALALHWYQLAADQGEASAQHNLGVMYDNGYGVPQDYAEAMRWYRRAADQGHASAQYNLGLMYYFGDGVPQDFLSAHVWANISSGNGHDGARNLRDEVAGKMTAEQIAEAQRRAKVCVTSKYQD